MAESLFISDLHLSHERPDTVRLFLRFLAQRASGANRLFILGDLFDAWIGDDNDAPPIPQILTALAEVAAGGVEVYFMRGNRDFLVGSRFAAATGCVLLEDPSVMQLDGTSILLMHGDLLCTDDLEYQQARKMVRSPAFIQGMLAKTIPERIALATEYRRRSGESTSLKAADIMDVNQQAVERYLRDHRATLLVHGHTHRPGRHDFPLDGAMATRIVLAEWHDHQGGYLRLAGGAFHSERFGQQ